MSVLWRVRLVLLGVAAERSAEEPGHFHGRLANLHEIRPPRVIGLRFGEHQLDEAENHRQMIAEGMKGRTGKRG